MFIVKVYNNVNEQFYYFINVGKKVRNNELIQITKVQ